MQINTSEVKIMEATMEMRKSNLVLPQGFVEMDRDEMMYVDGGKSLTISNNACCAILGAVTFGAFAGAVGLGFLVTTGAITISAIATKILVAFSSIMASIGPVGYAIIGVVGAYIVFNKDNVFGLCANIAKAAFCGGDVRVSGFFLDSDIV